LSVLAELAEERGRNAWRHAVAQAAIEHAMGRTADAAASFKRAQKLLDESLYSIEAVLYCRHLLNIGDWKAAEDACDSALADAKEHGWHEEEAWFSATRARLALATGRDAMGFVDEIRAATAHSGAMEWIIEAHLSAARQFLTSGDAQGALDEAESGLLHAVACGYGLLRIELLVVIARIRLAWPDAPKAVQAAREALDLATHPECQYAWGEADAAQVWGEAYVANHEPGLAKRALERALAVRKRIQHPGFTETEKWLARLS
jgi:tetratricopeptide (TPR) repeat protein